MQWLSRFMYWLFNLLLHHGKTFAALPYNNSHNHWQKKNFLTVRLFGDILKLRANIINKTPTCSVMLELPTFHHSIHISILCKVHNNDYIQTKAAQNSYCVFHKHAVTAAGWSSLSYIVAVMTAESNLSPATYHCHTGGQHTCSITAQYTINQHKYTYITAAVTTCNKYDANTPIQIQHSMKHRHELIRYLEMIQVFVAWVSSKSNHGILYLFISTDPFQYQ